MTKNIKAVYQGSFNDLESIKISPLSRAFLFSDSIYEVIPFQNNSFICSEEHFERLIYSASQLRIPINIKEIRDEIDHLFKNSSCSNGPGFSHACKNCSSGEEEFFDSIPDSGSRFVPVLNLEKIYCVLEENVTSHACTPVSGSNM